MAKRYIASQELVRIYFIINCVLNTDSIWIKRRNNVGDSLTTNPPESKVKKKDDGNKAIEEEEHFEFAKTHSEK